jgi:hypothetical protein
MLRTALMMTMMVLVIATGSAGQDTGITPELRAKIDGIVASAYRVATEKFPCKVKTRNKPKMMRWEVIDRCVNGAADQVYWEGFSDSLGGLRSSLPESRRAPFDAAVADSLTEQAILFEKVFTVKRNEGYLPLTNSMLKYLAPESLEGLQVIDKFGTRLGTFAGVYSYERTGGLSSANSFRLMLFQYQDSSGNIHSATGKLLLDSYGVSWKEAMAHIGFRLPFDRLDFGN